MQHFIILFPGIQRVPGNCNNEVQKIVSSLNVCEMVWEPQVHTLMLSREDKKDEYKKIMTKSFGGEKCFKGHVYITVIKWKKSSYASPTEDWRSF